MPAPAEVDVLIVDDQRTMRGLVRGCLAELGFRRIRECGDGDDALRQLAVHPAHLVISDLNMPGRDGLGLLQAIRAQPALRDVAFIMLTSVGDVEQVKAAIQLGVNNYLVKPFSLTSLKAKVEAVIGPLA